MLKGCQFPGEEQRAGCLGEQRNHKVELIKMFIWGKPVSLRQWRQIAQYEKRHSFNFFIQVTRQNDLLLASCSRCVTFKLSWKSMLIKWWYSNCSVFILFNVHIVCIFSGQRTSFVTKLREKNYGKRWLLQLECLPTAQKLRWWQNQTPFKDEPLLLIAIARWMTAGRTSLWHTGGDGEWDCKEKTSTASHIQERWLSSLLYKN